MAGVHSVYHCGNLQKGGNPGGIGIGPGIERAVEDTQVVVMGHHDDVFGGGGTSGNKADDVPAHALRRAETVEPGPATGLEPQDAEIAVKPVGHLMRPLRAGCTAAEGGICEIFYGGADMLLIENHIGIHGAYAVADALCLSRSCPRQKAEND